MAALGLFSCREPDRLWPPRQLRTGGALATASLAPNEVHRYRLPLREGQLLRLVVEQKDVDAVVAFIDPTADTILQVDRQSGSLGPELVLAVTAKPGNYTLIVSGGPESRRGHYTPRIEALRPASEIDRRNADAYRLFAAADGLPEDEAKERREGALKIWRQTGEVALQAEALEGIAMGLFDQGEYQAALDLFLRAAEAFRRTGNRRWEAITRNELGACLIPLGEAQEAAEQYTLALRLAREVGDRRNQFRALNGLGQAARNQGELQEALDRYVAALALVPDGDRALRPFTLHNLGVLYARYLGDPGKGAPLLRKALDAWPPTEDFMASKARTWSLLGLIADRLGRLEEARDDFEAALGLRRDRDPCQAAVILAGLARVKDRQGTRAAADARLAEAFEVVGSRPCPTSQPAVELLAADIAEGRDDFAGARRSFRRAELLYRWLGDRMGRATSLAGLARCERALGHLGRALEASRKGLQIFEGVRPTVLSDELRASFFSEARPAFEFQVELLLDMGNPAEAWITAERARARVLGDLLTEAGAGLGRSVPADLATKEGAVRRQLNALATSQLATSDSATEKLRARRQAIEEHMAELESLRGEIRRRSPSYSALQRPEPLSLAATQRELLDADTVLLEYQLGETASTLWVVTRESLTAHRLSQRSEIEPLAVTVFSGLKSLEGSGQGALCRLSEILLRPALPSLGRNRLVVVADGALEQLPFGALPVPTSSQGCSQAPLIEFHEIAYLPSVSTLVSQRRLLAGRRPAPGWLAVMADSVYDSADPRLPAALRHPEPASSLTLQRLLASSQEAAAITVGLPAPKFRVDTGFAASREAVIGGTLHGFRILHFATHGKLNAEQPLLSALVLSQYDAAGRRISGDLPAHEIYGLDLPAELVVLSACETALGHQVAGEGLVSGLPRAFLYAGAARVLVSLWPVQDRYAGELMSRFYDGLLHQGLAPARALQEAQRAMARKGLPPLSWAGFILLGDWRPLPPFQD